MTLLNGSHQVIDFKATADACVVFLCSSLKSTLENSQYLLSECSYGSGGGGFMSAVLIKVEMKHKE